MEIVDFFIFFGGISSEGLGLVIVRFFTLGSPLDLAPDT